jgi:hypothetical protein
MRDGIWAAGLGLSFVAVGVGLAAPLMLPSENTFCRPTDFCAPPLFFSHDDEPAPKQAPKLIYALAAAAWTGSTNGSSVMQRI